MVDDDLDLPPRHNRPAGKKKKVSGTSDERKEKNAQRAEQEEARREEIIRLMKEHGFHVTDEAFLDFMGMHLETVSHVEKSIGRPTKYHPLLDDWAIWLGKRGYSLKQIASMMGVSYETLWLWGKENAAFSNALTRAREAAQNWWETIGQAGLFSRDFNTFIWNKVISNRFRADYTDRKGLPYDPKSPDETEKVDDGVVQLDLRALTREQREILAIAIEGAQKQESE